jgi:hypothetical protein
MVNHKKKELGARYYYDNTDSIQEAVKRLPAGRNYFEPTLYSVTVKISFRLHPD